MIKNFHSYSICSVVTWGQQQRRTMSLLVLVALWLLCFLDAVHQGRMNNIMNIFVIIG